MLFLEPIQSCGHRRGAAQRGCYMTEEGTHGGDQALAGREGGGRPTPLSPRPSHSSLHTLLLLKVLPFGQEPRKRR